MIRVQEAVEPLPSVSRAFDDFLESRLGMGVRPATLKTYRMHMNAIGNRLDLSMRIDKLNQRVINKLIARFTNDGLSQRSIKSYVATLAAFISFCREEGWTDEKIKPFRAKETVKNTYSDEDLEKLLRKPNMNRCTFPEYRTWVIINLLMNNGCRAGTIVEILVKDVNFNLHQIIARHTKNGHIQALPMSSDLEEILKEYLGIRKGAPEDYLFCGEEGERLTVSALQSSFKRYNRKRKVVDTSIHEFRHTFAKKYITECGGDAFTLQKLLGHSTLDMTRHYCNIYDAELVRDYDARSPLTTINRRSGSKKIAMGR